MNEREQILYIKNTLKKILHKDVIRRYDVTISLELLEKWKQLTNYKEPKSNPIIDYEDCLDEVPKKKK